MNRLDRQAGKAWVRRLACLLAALACPPAMPQEPALSPLPSMSARSYGETLEISGENLAGNDAKFRLRSGRRDERYREFDAKAADDGKSVRLVLPANPSELPSANYLVSLWINGKEIPVPGHLEVRDWAPTLLQIPTMPALSLGDTLWLAGEHLAGRQAEIVLRAAEGGKLAQTLPTEVAADGRSLSAVLPAKADVLPTGKYLVAVAFNKGRPVQVGGQIELRSNPDELKITEVEPKIAYPGKDGFYEFMLTVDNIGRQASEIQLEIKDRLPQPLANCVQNADDPPRAPCIQLLAPVNAYQGRRLHVILKPESRGEQQVRVVTSDRVSAPVKIILARSALMSLLLAAFGIVAALVFAIVGPLKKAIAPTNALGRKRSTLAAFLIDEQTNSFSLSRSQLFLWLAVIVFGYVLLYLHKVLIQGDLHLPDVPDGVPGLLGVSAGTAVLSVGTTLARGSKGAGDIEPRFSDLISVGGMIVPERVQFFVWTLLGALGFLGVLLHSALTSTFSALPEIPPTMLGLMGISSAAYLGGKLTRSPGPVIRSIKSNPLGVAPIDKQTLVLRIQGVNLDSSAKFNIDGTLLGSFDYDIKVVENADGSLPSAGAAQPVGGNAAKFCTVMDITLKNAADYQLPRSDNRPHTLTIINFDGQSAAVEFPADMMVIDKEGISVRGKTATVKGLNFVAETHARWVAEGQAALDIPADQVVCKGVTEIAVSLPEAPAAGTKATLTLISPAWLKAAGDLTVLMLIDPPNDPPNISANANTIVVKGQNFADQTTAEWAVAGQAPVAIGASQLAVTPGVDRTEIVVTLPDTQPAGTAGTLTLISPARQRASVQVTF